MLGWDFRPFPRLGRNISAPPTDGVGVSVGSESICPPRPTILVVDDHRAVAELLTVALRADGFDRVGHVGAADSDLDAILAAAGELQPDIALVDLFLAGGSSAGLAAIRALDYRGIAVLAFTASDDPRDTALCLEAGAVAVLHKTEPFDVVLEALEKVAAGLLVDVGGNGLAPTLEAEQRTRCERLRRFGTLTSAETTVLRALIAGVNPQEIAARHSVSIRTIRSHVESIHRKLDVRSQLAAVALARDVGWPAD